MGGGGKTRVKGSDVSRMNSKKPTPIIPCTDSTRARSSAGRLSQNSDTSAPHSDSMKTHRIIEPSWFPQTPVIWYSNGLSVWLFCTTLRTVKSEVM